jgi:hypothetical protein
MRNALLTTALCLTVLSVPVAGTLKAVRLKSARKTHWQPLALIR